MTTATMTSKRQAPRRPPSAVAPSEPALPFDPDRAEAWTDVHWMADWTFTVDESLAYGAVWVSRARQIVVVNPEFWRTLESYDEAMGQFIEDVTGGAMASGMSFPVTSAGPYGEAARRRAAVEGQNVVMAKDAITQLMEQAESLVVQAASLNRTPTVGQREMFNGRYQSLLAGVAELEQRMEQLRAALSLAGTALMDLD